MKGTGVMLRIVDIRGDDYSIVEGVVHRGAEGYDQRYEATLVAYETRGAAAEMLLDGQRRSLGDGGAISLDRGQWHRLVNTGTEPWSFRATFRPPWNPRRAFQRYRDREVPGSEMWFEVRMSVADRIARAMYRLNEISAGEGNVDVLLNPGASSLVEFHKRATTVVRGVRGEGVIRIDRKAQRVGPGVEVRVQPGQRYELRNPGAADWQVKLVHRPQWEPHDTFYVSPRGRITPGDQVWFEVVVPD